ncbi:MAG: HDOD domain-containing protein [Myxococcota bacterium]|jgi:HD-like signal output (HDOD) protein
MDFDAELVALMKRNAVRVPACPVAALKLRAVLGQPEHDVADVVEAVKGDAALAAAVLRVANSVYFRREQPATTLKAAVQRVGERELERLALAAGLAGEFLRDGPLAVLRRAIWHESMTTAVACEALARARPGFSADEAFVGGLLCDVGRLVVVGALEQLLARDLELRARPAGEWVELVDRYHVELGLVLAARWGLPDVISDVISQHQADVPLGPFAELVALVQAGSRLAALLGDGLCVSAEALRAVAWLQTDEQRQAAAEALAEAAATIAGFAPEPPAGSSRSLVIEPPLERAPPAEPFDVRLVARGERCPGVALSPERVQFTALSPLTPNYLVELELERAGAVVRAWTRVTACRPLQGMHLVEAAPFAVSPRVADAWRELCASPGKGSGAPAGWRDERTPGGRRDAAALR